VTCRKMSGEELASLAVLIIMSPRDGRIARARRDTGAGSSGRLSADLARGPTSTGHVSQGSAHPAGQTLALGPSSAGEGATASDMRRDGSGSRASETAHESRRVGDSSWRIRRPLATVAVDRATPPHETFERFGSWFDRSGHDLRTTRGPDALDLANFRIDPAVAVTGPETTRDATPLPARHHPLHRATGLLTSREMTPHESRRTGSASRWIAHASRRVLAPSGLVSGRGRLVRTCARAHGPIVAIPGPRVRTHAAIVARMAPINATDRPSVATGVDMSPSSWGHTSRRPAHRAHLVSASVAWCEPRVTTRPDASPGDGPDHRAVSATNPDARPMSRDS
jgi:hypothetical protein